MQFNPENGQGIIDDAYFEVGATSITYPINDVVRNANIALDNVITLIIGADSTWHFDSRNSTDLPIGSTDIIQGQSDYSFNTAYLDIVGPIQAYVPGANGSVTGNWVELVPVSKNNLNPVSGIPYQYTKVGESFIVDDIPNYNMRLSVEGTAGLKAFFQRKIDYFSTTDTTKEPGFASHLHKYVSLYIAYAYAYAKNLSKAQELQERMLWYTGNISTGGNVVGEIRRFYSKRQGDVKPGLRANVEDTH